MPLHLGCQDMSAEERACRLVEPRLMLAAVDNPTSLNGARMSTFSNSPCTDLEAM
jgi:hypothetical protein